MSEEYYTRCNQLKLKKNFGRFFGLIFICIFTTFGLQRISNIIQVTGWYKFLGSDFSVRSPLSLHKIKVEQIKDSCKFFGEQTEWHLIKLVKFGCVFLNAKIKFQHFAANKTKNNSQIRTKFVGHFRPFNSTLIYRNINVRLTYSTNDHQFGRKVKSPV